MEMFKLFILSGIKGVLTLFFGIICAGLMVTLLNIISGLIGVEFTFICLAFLLIFIAFGCNGVSK